MITTYKANGLTCPASHLANGFNLTQVKNSLLSSPVVKTKPGIRKGIGEEYVASVMVPSLLNLFMDNCLFDLK
ncbi:hypothetical protein EVAR_93883_1 [Eumeta japonica]|uniref:Uncharacterized protein n=1 Tax=Eumeta variegata TaxID=151549 RepID=A0A4C1TX20_EUMVA|nr:hypothetical protein EVAR_93883_1 [Eumeta japonica]